MSSVLADENAPPLVAVTCTPYSARLNLCLNLYIQRLIMFIPLWDWCLHSLFLSIRTLGFEKLVQLSWCSCPSLSHAEWKSWFLCEGKAAQRWVLESLQVVFSWSQLKTSLSGKAGGFLQGCVSQNHWIEQEKSVPWFSLVLYSSLHTYQSVWEDSTTVQHEVLKNPSLRPFCVFKLQTGQEYVLVKPPWVLLASASLVQDKAYTEVWDEQRTSAKHGCLCPPCCDCHCSNSFYWRRPVWPQKKTSYS